VGVLFFSKTGIKQSVETARRKAARRRAARAKLLQLCARCGATEGLTLDHIIARAYGGTNV
jgi:5-methylcytosine-specific restriction endonuclease McrA